MIDLKEKENFPNTERGITQKLTVTSNIEESSVSGTN